LKPELSFETLLIRISAPKGYNDPTYTLPSSFPPLHIAVYTNDNNSGKNLAWVSESLNDFTQIDLVNCNDEQLYETEIQLPVDYLNNLLKECAKLGDFTELLFTPVSYNVDGSLYSYPNPIGNHDLWPCIFINYTVELCRYCGANEDFESSGRGSIDNQNREKLFPNPFDKSFAIEYLNGNEMVLITDLEGKLIFSEKVHYNRIEIETSQWKSGVYFVKILSELSSTSTRIVKQ